MCQISISKHIYASPILIVWFGSWLNSDKLEHRVEYFEDYTVIIEQIIVERIARVNQTERGLGVRIESLYKLIVGKEEIDKFL